MRALVTAVLLSAVLAASAQAYDDAAPRTTVNFDFAWRFQRGIDPRNQQCTYEQGKNYGTKYIWAGATATKEECCNECINRQMCVAWDWRTQGTSGLCWVKDNADGNNASDSRHWSGLMGPAWPVGNGTVPPPAQMAYDDSHWTVIDAPHDIGRTDQRTCLQSGRRLLSQQGDEGMPDFLHNCSGWYRKKFSLPAEWEGGVTWVYFEGVMHDSVVWLNGKRLGHHIQGYTSFWYRLDNNGARYGDGQPNQNVLTVFANAEAGIGYDWYQGGGLFRHQFLVHTASTVFLPPDRSWVHASTAYSKVSPSGSTAADGDSASNVTLTAEGLIHNAANATASSVWVQARFKLGDLVVGTATAGPFSVSAGAERRFSVITVPDAPMQLWSVSRPSLYSAEITLTTASDAANAHQLDKHPPIVFGVREVTLSSSKGLLLNNRPVKMRGVCDHSNFGGVGAAVPDRVNLYRAQGLRAAGVNSWRMAHNPPQPIRLDIMDRLGMLALDENHYYGGHDKPYGVYDPEGVDQSMRDMADLVQRDRSHASVFAWNFCNEVNCDNATAAPGMRNITDTFDGTRAVTMNHLMPPEALALLDIQGMSHRAGAHMDSFHAANPSKPYFSSEAVICESERGVDSDFCPEPGWLTQNTSSCQFNNEVANCTATQTLPSDIRPENAGTYIWSGYDYRSGNTVAESTATGVIGDVAGFLKPLRWWIKSWWLSNISHADAGRPALWPEAAAAADNTVHIVDAWVPPPAGNTTRSIHVYTNAPWVRLWLNNQLVGEAVVAYWGQAVFPAVHYQAGNLTAEALTGTAGSRASVHTIQTPGLAYQLQLTVVSPSPVTGTGVALVADGQDTAMVSAQIVDSSGRQISPQDPKAALNITFSIVSGSGRILGIHSGTPNDAIDGNPDLNPEGYAAHYGMVMAFIQSTEICVGTQDERTLLRSIHSDLGVDGTSFVPADCGPQSELPIVVRAAAPGLVAGSIDIPLTTERSHLPLAVAKRSSLQGFN